MALSHESDVTSCHMTLTSQSGSLTGGERRASHGRSLRILGNSEQFCLCNTLAEGTGTAETINFVRQEMKKSISHNAAVPWLKTTPTFPYML